MTRDIRAAHRATPRRRLSHADLLGLFVAAAALIEAALWGAAR